MRSIFLVLISTILTLAVQAQKKIVVQVKDFNSKQPIQNVFVVVKGFSTTTDSRGIALIPNDSIGLQALVLRREEYNDWAENFVFPILDRDSLYLFMQPVAEEEELEEVIVQSTRTSRTVANTPTRVETIDGEELDEKNNMRPANVSMLLHESTGLQVQQTSATSGNSSIRVQGLDGRYTQLLKDGFPNYGNFASGLSILEIPPLDLKQIEVIKGPASTLYGGGAIAGVVNFISKLPSEEFEANLLFNQSNIGQRNIGAFLSQKKGKIGYSFLGLVNRQKEYDVDADNFSELPRMRNFTINPNLFFYPNASTTIRLGNSFTRGANTGGDMLVIDEKPTANNVYFERNKTERNVSTLEVEKRIKGQSLLKLKNSLSLFDRKIELPAYTFDGLSTNSYNELSVLTPVKKHTINSGINYVYDHFKQKNQNQLDNHSTTIGVYIQDTWDISDALKLESGLRVDHVRFRNNPGSGIGDKNQTFVLPRASLLAKINRQWSSRISAGLGYKTPTLFTEQTERDQYRFLAPLADVVAEKSVGVTADFNYKTRLTNDLSFSINQLFFYTNISNPLVLGGSITGLTTFRNANKPALSKGFETNAKFIFKEDLKLFIGYTFTDARATYVNNKFFLPLVPASKLNLTLMYEKEDNFKIGLEAYGTGSQTLSNGNKVPAYWELGFMAQKTIKQFSFFINFENFTDERQSNYKSVVNGSNINPSFDEIWNHTEGFVMNGGVKIKLGK